jgi:hypothetical protein
MNPRTMNYARVGFGASILTQFSDVMAEILNQTSFWQVS